MAALTTLHFLALVLIALTTASVAGWALVRGDPIEGRNEFVILAAAVELWTLNAGWIMFISSEPGLLFGFYMRSFFQWVTPALFVLFTVSYSRNREWLELTSMKLILYGLPLFFLFASLTNPVHNLMFTDINVATDPFGQVIAQPAALFFLANMYAYTCLTAGFLLIGWISVRSGQVSRKQVTIVGSGLIIVVATLTAQLIRVVPVPGFDYTILAFGGSYATLGYLFLRDPTLDIGPLARQRLVEALDTAIIVLTPSQKIADYNRAAVASFPALENSIGAPVKEVVPDLFDEIPDDGEPIPAEVATLTIDDKQYAFEITVSTITEGNETRGYGVVLTDITERRERTRNLKQQTEQLEQFASIVSHALRNPLTVAQTHAALINQEATDETITEHAMEANESLDRAEKMVEDLLILAKEGKAIHDRTYVALDEIVDEACQTSPIPTPTVTNTIGNIEVYADADRLQTVFEYLFRNIVDHAEEDVDVEVGLLEEETGFYIEDDGPGIPDEKKEKIFGYGYTSRDEGTGFGLNIVKMIIEAHGWEIHVTDGDKLEGARFEITAGDLRSASMQGEHSADAKTLEFSEE